MISFGSCAVGSRSFCIEFPGDHAFANMDSTIVDNTCFYNIVSICFEDFTHAPADEDIAQVPEMKRLVCIGR